MNFRVKCKFYTAVVGIIFLLLENQPAKSQHIMLIAENMQKDSIQVDSSNKILIQAVAPVQAPVKVLVKREFAKLPDGVIKDQFTCLQKDVPLTYNKLSRSIIHSFLTRDRSFIYKMLEKQQIYFPIYEQMFQKYGLPDELKYLSIVESALNPKAYSRARALGLWQFMPATGRQYKLHQDAYIDERMDPYKATEAACRYLKDLHGMFGDWELALAAYNCGPGNVRRAIRRSGNKKTFWQICHFLPKETRAYVPKFVAITYLMQHAEDYNISATANTDFIQSDTILLNQYLNMEVFAKQIHIPLDVLRELNPHIKKNIIPGHIKNYCLRIPSLNKEWFAMNRADILQMASVKKSSRSYGGTASKRKILYTVKQGDVINEVADIYHVRITDIQRWNRLKSKKVQPGQKLVIYVNEDSSLKTWIAGRQNMIKKPALIAPIRIHFVKPGHTLPSISKIYVGVPVEKSKRNNKLKTNDIRPGQKIIIG